VTRRQGLPSCRHRGQMTFKAPDTGQTRCHARVVDGGRMLESCLSNRGLSSAHFLIC
jgi:hypothetical protein